MTPIKRKLLYIFRGTLLRLRITWNHGESLTVSVGYNVDKTDAKGKAKWDGNRCRINTTHGIDKIPAATINKVLERLEESIDRAFLEFEITDSIPTKEELKNKINGTRLQNSFFACFDKFISEGESISQWSNNTIRKMKTLRKLMRLYSPDLKFSEVDANFMSRFMAWQTSNAITPSSKIESEDEEGNKLIKYKGKYQNGTINRNVKHLKWFLRWAVGKGFMHSVDFLNHKMKYKTTKRPVIYLTWDELMAVYNLDLSTRPELAKTRDMFCLECFTSLRYSDIINLKWGNVKDDHLEITTIKTTDAIIIDLNDYSREIINKYRKDDVKGDDKVFQEKSSQKMNVRIKEIAEMCHIDTPVTLVEMYGSERREITVPKYKLIATHTGRRTFIVNALSMGIPPNVVMKWTGHSDYKSMQPYIDIADNARKKSMDVFNRKSEP